MGARQEDALVVRVSKWAQWASVGKKKWATCCSPFSKGWRSKRATTSNDLEYDEGRGNPSTMRATPVG